jgi:hypothetical protein
MDDDPDRLEQRIRERAYRIWLEEGCPDGRDEAHWERAKAEIANQNEPAEAN